MTLSALRPTDGAGTWQRTAPHRTLRLTTSGTLLLTGLLVVLFVLVVHAGQQLECRIDRATYGHGAHQFCDDFRPVGVQP
jgi:hypothetical protein